MLKEGLYQLDLTKASSRIRVLSHPLQSPSLFFSHANIASSNSQCHTHCSKSESLSNSPSVPESNKVCNSANIWHMRLGHPTSTVLSQVLKSVNSIQSNKAIDFCIARQYGKMHQFSFPPSQTKTAKPFEIIYSDLCGSSPHLSTEGFRYYVHFVDDYTSFTWIFPFRTKSEAYSIRMWNFKSSLKDNLSTKLSVYRLTGEVSTGHLFLFLPI